MVDYERRLLTLVGLITFAFLPILAASLYFLFAVSASQDRLDGLYTQTVILAHDLRVEKLKQNSLMPVIVLTGDRGLVTELRASDRQFDVILANLRTVAHDAEARRALDEVAALQARLRAVEEPGLALRLGGAPPAQVNAYFQRNAGPSTTSSGAALDRFIVRADARYQAERARNQRAFHGAFWVLAVASAAAFVFCAFVGRLLLQLVGRKRELDLANARLAQRDRDVAGARKEAVEIVAHDLKNPITAILFATENLSTDPALAGLPRALSTVETIRLSTETMNRLIHNVLDHSKIEAGGLVLAKETVDLRRLLAQTAGQFSASAARKGVDFHHDFPERAMVLQADEARIGQVVSNLLANAIKFTAPGGSVRLSGAVADGEVVVQVRDTGWGMSPEQVARIFDRYWQAEGAAPHGAGLGLTISKAIVEAHGGRLAIATTLGEGSTFRVILPLAA
jgi:signal transduction histidine kinase